MHEEIGEILVGGINEQEAPKVLVTHPVCARPGTAGAVEKGEADGLDEGSVVSSLAVVHGTPDRDGSRGEKGGDGTGGLGCGRQRGAALDDLEGLAKGARAEAGINLRGLLLE